MSMHISPSGKPERLSQEENCLKNLGFRILNMGLIAFSGISLSAQCLTGPGSPNITGNVPFGPPINWANPNRVEVSDDLYARTSLNAGETSKYLMVRDFQFLIPTAATILGIQAAIERHSDSGSFIEDASVRIMKGGIITGNDYAFAGNWPQVDEVKGYGGSADLWGETWTAADIMNPGFGLVISVTRNLGLPNLMAYIDNIDLTIFYDDGTGCVLGQMVSALSAIGGQAGEVILKWDFSLPEMASGILLEHSDDGEKFQPLDQSGQDANSYSYAPEKSGYHHYRISVSAPGIGIVHSNIASVWLEEKRVSGPEIWPNPTNGTLYIQKKGCETPCTGMVRDLTGKELFSFESQDEGEVAMLDVSALNPGYYILKWGAGPESIEERFGVVR